MTDPAPTVTPPSGITSPLAYPQVHERVSEILRGAPFMGTEHNAVVWRAVAAAFAGADDAGLLADTPPPPPRRIRRALVLRRHRGAARA